MYHITDRDDGHDDGDDGGGSTAYPSRTSWGAAFSLEEKHPHLFHYRWFTKAWGYWDGYTKSQIKLMALDGPVVNYHHNKKGKKGDVANFTAKKAQDMWRRWEEHRGGKTFAGKKGVSISEIFE